LVFDCAYCIYVHAIIYDYSGAKLGTTYKSRPLKSEEHKRKIAEAIQKKWQVKKQRG
jgi:hypothetical protein